MFISTEPICSGPRVVDIGTTAQRTERQVGCWLLAGRQDGRTETERAGKRAGASESGGESRGDLVDALDILSWHWRHANQVRLSVCPSVRLSVCRMPMPMSVRPRCGRFVRTVRLILKCRECAMYGGERTTTPRSMDSMDDM